MDWNYFFFTDEHSFNLDGPECFKYHLHDLCDKPKLFGTRQQFGDSFMLCGSIYYNGTLYIELIDRKMDLAYYFNVLEQGLLPISKKILSDIWTLHQEGARVHRSDYKNIWLEEN